MKNRKFWVSLLAGIMAAIMLISLIASLMPRAYAESSSEIRDQINDYIAQQNQIQEQIDELNAQRQENVTEIQDMVAQKGLVDQQIALLHKQIDVINEQISAYSVLIADKQDELDEAEARLAELNAKNKDRIRAMEENGKLSYWSVLFKASSFADLLDRLSMIEEIADSDQRRIAEMSAAAQVVAAAKDELEAEKGDLENSRRELDGAQSELDSKRAELDDILTQLEAKGKEYDRMILDYQEMEEQFIEEIAELEARWLEAFLEEERIRKESEEASRAEEERRRQEEEERLRQEEEERRRQEEEQAAIDATRETDPNEQDDPSDEPTEDPGQEDPTEATEPEQTEPTEPEDRTPNPEEGWMVPVDYILVSSAYGWREPPTDGASSFHGGIDLAANEGVPVYATRSGYVTMATYHWSLGNYVTVNHLDGYSSSYCHLESYVVSEGEYVHQGDLLGYVGMTGTATGPHLHFIIYYDGSTVNPADYIPF